MSMNYPDQSLPQHSYCSASSGLSKTSQIRLGCANSFSGHLDSKNRSGGATRTIQCPVQGGGTCAWTPRWTIVMRSPSDKAMPCVRDRMRQLPAFARSEWYYITIHEEWTGRIMNARLVAQCGIPCDGQASRDSEAFCSVTSTIEWLFHQKHPEVYEPVSFPSGSFSIEMLARASCDFLWGCPR